MMYNTVAFIPVRGGSKGIKNKNIKSIASKPLVQWSIEAAVASKEIDKVFVSTDSESIKTVVLSLGLDKVKVIDRSSETATDNASTESALMEFATSYEFKSVVLIQATSPLINSTHLDESVKLHYNHDLKSVLSVVLQKRFIWDYTKDGFIEPNNYDHFNRPRRQEFEGYLVENGSLYITSKQNLIKSNNRVSGHIVPYVMPEPTYYEIDELSDWIIIENLLLQASRKKEDKKLAINNNIKLFLSDVDGVLTDAGMYYSNNGDELKKFNTKDGMGFQLLREKNIKTGIITSEATEIVSRRASKLQVDFLYQGKKSEGKLNAAREICEILDISLNEVAYVGDDINCLELLSSVGLAACPSDAVHAIKEIPGIIHLTSEGGQGAVRELVELILNDIV